jgi:hypothetical protein
MLCQFFLPNLSVGCALLISEIKRNFHFCIGDYPWLKSGKGLVILNCSVDCGDLFVLTKGKRAENNICASLRASILIVLVTYTNNYKIKSARNILQKVR